MKVIYGINNVKKRYKRPVVAIGIFDGLHLGHQCLIKRAVDRARAIRGTSVVITFFPHPVSVLHPRIRIFSLISLEDRIRHIREMGVKVCFVVHFTKKFSNLSPRQFIEEHLLQSINPTEIFVGENFRFGKNRSGDFYLLKVAGKRYGFKVNKVASVRKGRHVISSSLVRKLIMSGKIDQAKKFLGRPVYISGKVMRGDGRGKKLGFPTANIKPFAEIIPSCGVYLAHVCVDNRDLKGIANIGVRPSFGGKNKSINIEVHIFDFKKNIYGQDIKIDLLSKIRIERKFPSKADLINQLKRDKKKACSLLRKS